MKVFLIFLILIAFFIVKGIANRIYYLHRFARTYDELDRIGLITTVSGNIGAGKSILCSMFTQLLTFKIIDKLESVMGEIERILIEVNFVKVEELIKKYELNIDNLDDSFLLLLQEYEYIDDKKNIVLINKLDKMYFDFINYRDRTKLLKRWVECYLHLQRTNFVFANIRLFNHITSSYSYPFENSWIHLKITDDFPLVKNSIFFEDDKSLYSNNMQYQKKMAEDTGSDVFMRLFRHLFEESSYYLVSLQDVERWIKWEREISTSHIYVENSVIVGEYKCLNFLINCIEKLFNVILRVVKRFYKNERYYNNLNFFKKLNFKLDHFRKKLFANTYVRSRCIIYDDIDKVGKEIKKGDQGSYRFSYIAPIYYFFGNLNSHEFHEVYEYIYRNSKVKYMDLKEFIFEKEKVLEVLGQASTSSNLKNVNIF